MCARGVPHGKGQTKPALAEGHLNEIRIGSINRPDRLRKALILIRVHLPNHGTFGSERTLRADDVLLQRGSKFSDNSLYLRVSFGAADLGAEAADLIISISRHRAALWNGNPLADAGRSPRNLTDGNKEKV